MKLKCLTADMVTALKAGATLNAKKYDGNNHWFETLANERQGVRETPLDVASLPRLASPSKNETKDAENCRLIHAALKGLSPIQAMDERLWGWLTHSPYWSYTCQRWTARTPGAIVDRFLFDGAGFGTLVRNGMSRLWWFGHLTWDPSRSDPYELADVLLSNQDVQQALLQRSFGKSRPVLHAVLDHIKDHRDTLYSENLGGIIKAKAIELNLMGGVTLLDAMPRREIEKILVTEL